VRDLAEAADEVRGSAAKDRATNYSTID
jgi:hypothetical protein